MPLPGSSVGSGRPSLAPWLPAGPLLLGLATACATPQGHDWGYDGSAGPDAWAELSSEFVLAERGGSQSPVDIVSSETVDAALPPLALDYGSEPLRILNDGHTVEAIVGPGHDLVVGRRSYELLQFHVHVPSEHTVDGRHAQAELHFVHRTDDGLLAVVGVLIELGDETTLPLAEFVRNAPLGPAPEHELDEVLLELRALLPEDLGYWAYDGSLTTPPATEGVRWFVLEQAVTMTPHDLRHLRQAYQGNNRPPQPLNARWVLHAAHGSAP